ncbi:Transcriptional regulator, contains XRE-family HTH domain [Burkholderia sp. WP9]|uniref:helix-turn-helix domain-containing protein n=1 Tax=Burkholderia sp. WP9 TaxID=1500263 RepID=UPI0008953523|nr:helix-turn-helix transcriptional regulator [Burkholderia sp. WP9]SEB60935.1 Transcriptional regulator, contains XRE-family HTH domain [Burkholderia sp. WP9]
MPTLDEAVALGLSERLKKIRKRVGISQDGLAAKASVSRANVTALEQKRHANVRLTTLVQLANVLEVDVLDFLLDREEEKQLPEKLEPLERVIANVKALRKKKKLSQEALSEAAGHFRTYVGRLENRVANPLLVDLQDLGAALDATLTRLLQPPEKQTRR